MNVNTNTKSDTGYLNRIVTLNLPYLSADIMYQEVSNFMLNSKL
jgi:hypothetical protein